MVHSFMGGDIGQAMKNPASQLRIYFQEAKHPIHWRRKSVTPSSANSEDAAARLIGSRKIVTAVKLKI